MKQIVNTRAHAKHVRTNRLAKVGGKKKGSRCTRSRVKRVFSTDRRRYRAGSSNVIRNIRVIVLRVSCTKILSRAKISGATVLLHPHREATGSGVKTFVPNSEAPFQSSFTPLFFLQQLITMVKRRVCYTRTFSRYAKNLRRNQRKRRIFSLTTDSLNEALF